MRTISWFSCGAASAVATKLALVDGPVTIVNCEVKEEHPDNKRFLKDCEEWFGQEIIILGNDDYNRSIYDVFEKEKYLAGRYYAPCTNLLKKDIRKQFERPGDRQVFGYTVEEQDRVDRFIDANNDVDLITPLIDRGLTKADCLAMIVDAGIELPAMYKLGYKNNNCRGCVRASSPAYYAKIKIDFPHYAEKMNNMEKKLGVNLLKIDMKSVKSKYPDIYNSLGKPSTTNEKGGATYWRFKIDEIPESIEPMDETVDIQCGIFCELAEQEYRK